MSFIIPIYVICLLPKTLYKYIILFILFVALNISKFVSINVFIY